MLPADPITHSNSLFPERDSSSPGSVHLAVDDIFGDEDFVSGKIKIYNYYQDRTKFKVSFSSVCHVLNLLLQVHRKMLFGESRGGCLQSFLISSDNVLAADGVIPATMRKTPTSSRAELRYNWNMGENNEFFGHIQWIEDDCLDPGAIYRGLNGIRPENGKYRTLRNALRV